MTEKSTLLQEILAAHDAFRDAEQAHPHDLATTILYEAWQGKLAQLRALQRRERYDNAPPAEKPRNTEGRQYP